MKETNYSSKWQEAQREKLGKAIDMCGSQTELARIVGVHKQQISRWKSCQVRMSLDAWIKLENILDRLPA